MTKHREAGGDWRRAARFVAAGLLAAAGVLATPHPVAAQYRSNNDGRALDANSRSGSGGQNDSSPTAANRGQAVSGNQIITGNVTAGRQFRGPVPYSDPGSFRGPTAGSFSSDRFVRQSAGVPTPYGANIDLTQPMAYYGSRHVTPPPVGYLPTAGATGSYVGADPTGVAAQSNNVLSRTYSPALDSSFRSSELIMSTQDAANRDSMLSASPLYGVRVWRAGESPNDFLAGDRGNQGNGQNNGQTNGQPNGQSNDPNNGARQSTFDRGDRFRDPNSILRMRDELNRASAGNDNGQNQGQNGNDQNGQQGGDANGPGVGNTGFSRPLNQSLNQSGATGRGQDAGGSVAVGALNSTIGGNNNALQSSVATGQSIQQRLVVSPDRQTPELARLRRAFERQQPGNDQTDVQAARQFNRELTAQRQRAAQGNQPGNQQPGAQPGQAPGGANTGNGAVPSGPRNIKVAPPPDETPATAPDTTTPQVQLPGGPAAAPAPAPAPEPEKIGSIAEGVQAKGLHDVLTSAEELMRSQKFSEALQKYDVAQQVAPNNALITMGRANAELAASYYRRAETSLRDAVGRSPEVVVAQFDLRSLIGQDRLQVLVRDLKELSTNDPKQARAPLLLAYIAYNTGNEAQAGDYLATAEQRAGADDSLIKAWRRSWKLPAAGATEPAPQPDGNK